MNQLTSYQQQLVVDNKGLIYLAIKQLKLHSKTEDEFQDYYDAGIIGLIKGAKKYDENAGYKPSTFLTICIKNEIKHFLMHKTTQKNNIPGGYNLSLDQPITTEDGNKTTFSELIPDTSINIEKQIEQKFEYNRILQAIEKLENKKDKLFIKYKYGLIDGKEYLSKDIAKIFNVSCTLVDVRIKRAIIKIKEILRIEKYKNKLIGGNMGKNLESLNSYLFDELERLNQNDILKDEDLLMKEINRSKAISSIATNIINNANVVIEVNKLFNKSNSVPELLGIPKK